MTHAENRQRAHLLIDHMGSKELGALVCLLEATLDPVSFALANAPFDDEPVSEEEAREIAASRESGNGGHLTSHEEVLAEFGLGPGAPERMGRAPIESETHDNGR